MNSYVLVTGHSRPGIDQNCENEMKACLAAGGLAVIAMLSSIVVSTKVVRAQGAEQSAAERRVEAAEKRAHDAEIRAKAAEAKARAAEIRARAAKRASRSGGNGLTAAEQAASNRLDSAITDQHLRDAGRR